MQTPRYNYAEDVGHYWKTSRSSSDKWINKTKTEILNAKGKIIAEAYGAMAGKASFMIQFEFGDNHYKVIWPVLKSKTNNSEAAKVQAATMLYHDVKAKCVSAKVLGFRAAFHSYLLLDDGRIASQLTAPEFVTQVPAFMLPAQTD